MGSPTEVDGAAVETWAFTEGMAAASSESMMGSFMMLKVSWDKASGTDMGRQLRKTFNNSCEVGTRNGSFL